MPRKPRFAPPGYWLHITQRGNYRQDIFRHSPDRAKYLKLLAQYAEERQVQILGYCLMSNHVHLIALGKYPNAISDWMRCLSGHYAQQMHALMEKRGRFWQDRFYSSVLDERHLHAALRYVELNPVRAGLVSDATQYKWSSAVAHTQADKPAPFLNQFEFARRYSRQEWRRALAAPQSDTELNALRLATKLGHPLGSPEFLAHLEAEFDVSLPRPAFHPQQHAAGA
jgi:putative transposase